MKGSALSLMMFALTINASDQPLSTSSGLELSYDYAVADVFFKGENDVVQGGCLVIKIDDRGIAQLRCKSAPFRTSVFLSRMGESRGYDARYEYIFRNLSEFPNTNLAITKDSIDFSVDKELFAEIKAVPRSTMLCLSYAISQQEAQELQISQEDLNELAVQEFFPMTKLRRLISQE